MPHTSRKKKSLHSKRREILDDDGWTRITSGFSAPPTIQTPPTDSESEQDSNWTAGGDATIELSPPISLPMSAAKGSTLETMRAQFAGLEARWQETNLCKMLEQTVTDKILTGKCKVSNCAVFGTGSFCGDAVHWIDRHESAYFQLAAFRTVVKAMERMQAHPLQAYAQEPYYNDLDSLFLASLNITKVDHPKAFELLDRNSFVYSPAAEQEIESQIMSRGPRIWLHRSFDHSLLGGQEAKASFEAKTKFKQDHEHAEMPELALKNFPFHGSVMWWRKDDGIQGHVQAS
ncbi:uncharacterized protein A1O5_12694 [Cladophialophora psammophila CBS 110553]|uniref:SRR1-like domain-containing protein n=1 Tax=Cladophialophora psammophila CBS 110553 TaxID=1182543 RepID=W9VL45_9EURO|nr:uncharacterized protein A1O5_12694 [Cladophialophora psammophila CBS 110553]EXJ56238.1 hypothetical protein A1O5_12694 [Cladophialophora psammophila CBS 110553]